ncbi:hypothetical protein SpCBS45565_g07676 [Spizellomyces sp. 'palustris']|nr:hypothetical protein SpCBS45565_g07676 [Spizellomyces sp. 'palustris']
MPDVKTTETVGNSSSVESQDRKDPTSPGAFRKLWKGYFGKASKEDVSLAWQAVSHLAQTGESLFRLENASWRIWSRKTPTESPEMSTIEQTEQTSTVVPVAQESPAPAPAPTIPTGPGRRPTLLESYLPQKIAELPTTVLERLKKDSVTGTISSLLGEPLADLISSAIARAEATGLLDIGEAQYDRWRLQSSPTSFIKKWNWLSGRGGKGEGLDRIDSAVDLDADGSIDEIFKRVDTDKGDDENSIAFLLPPPVPPNTPSASPGVDALVEHCRQNPHQFRKRSVQAIPIKQPSLLSKLIDESLKEQDVFQAAAQRRRLMRLMRRRAIEFEGEDKRGMDVETYMKLVDACDDAASTGGNDRHWKPSDVEPFGDSETRRKVTDTAQSLIDPTWRIRDTRSRRMPWFERSRSAIYDDGDLDSFLVW